MEVEIRPIGDASRRFSKGQAKRPDFPEILRNRDYGALEDFAGRKLVDPFANVDIVRDSRLEIDKTPCWDSKEWADELIELYGRALARRTPYANHAAHEQYRGNLPGSAGGKFVSFFLNRAWDYNATTILPRYRVYKWNVYGTTLRDYQAIALGQKFAKPRSAGFSEIVTPWGGACYVHQDHNLQYIGVDAILEDVGCPMNPRLAEQLAGVAAFGNFGGLHRCALRGELLRAAWVHAFAEKWRLMRARPEEYAATVQTYPDRLPNTAEYIRQSPEAQEVRKRYGSYFLPLAYPEGSPMHPSAPAGHSIFAHANDCLTCLLWDGSFVLPNGRTVAQESQKLADNVGLWRLDAGVHYRSDHNSCRAIARQVTERLVLEHLAKWKGAHDVSYQRDDSSTAYLFSET